MTPVLFVVSRTQADGRFTYMTPHWADARGYLVALLEQHGTKRARNAASRVPTSPPGRAWGVRVNGCRYELGRRDPGQPGGGVG
jgi:hypothetical protein